jgi:hypothetical protein
MDSFWVGRMLEAQTETSDGQKRSDSKCSSAPSISCTQDFPESLHMGTTPVSLKVGGQVVTATLKPTPSFDAFTPVSLKPITAERFAHDTSRAQKTQRMGHREENTLRHISSFREFPFPLPSFPSSLMQAIPSPQMSRDPPHPPPRTFCPTPYTQDVKTSETRTPGGKPLARRRMTSSDRPLSNDECKLRFDTPLHSRTASPSAPALVEPTPRPYTHSLTPRPSLLRPHCLARDHLQFWQPASTASREMSDSEGSPIPVPESHLDRILDVIAAAWTEQTKETYGSGLLTYHVYCDIHNIPDAQRAPISQSLLAAFIASCAGAYSGSAISNYTASLRAWHLLHGVSWVVNVDETRSILEGASRLAPASSSHQKRIPFE